MADSILEIRNLTVAFPEIRNGRRVWKNVLSGVQLDIARGRTLGLVGESGSGKTTLGRAILGLVPVRSGSITYHQDTSIRLDQLSERKFRPLRGKLQIVFQDPFSSLNPRLSVGEIIEEALRPSGISSQERQNRCLKVLDRVGLASTVRDRYPHEFSGGQRQRISIARALVLNPEFIVCDESVSALDVSVQAQILNLFIDLQEDLGLTYLFISHDLSVIRHISHEVAVLEGGVIVESGPAVDVCDRPAHEYTKRLLSSVPTLNPAF